MSDRINTKARKDYAECGPVSVKKGWILKIKGRK